MPPTPITFIQSKSVNSLGSVTTQAVVMNANPVAGRLLCVAVLVDSTAVITGVSSVADGQFTPAGTIWRPPGGGATVSAHQIFYVLKTAGGVNAATITATTAGGSNIVIIVHEVGGFVNCQLDTTGAASYKDITSASSNPVSASITNTTADAYIFTYDSESTTVSGVNAPFNLREAVTGGHASADRIVSTPTTSACTFLTGSGTHGMGIIAFSDPGQADVNLALMAPAAR